MWLNCFQWYLLIFSSAGVTRRDSEPGVESRNEFPGVTHQGDTERVHTEPDYTDGQLQHGDAVRNTDFHFARTDYGSEGVRERWAESGRYD